MLTRNDDGIGELAGKIVRIGGVDGLTDGVGCIGGGLADDGFVVVVELDNGVEVGGVRAAVLGLGQMEGAVSCCIGWRWGRGGRGHCCRGCCCGRG